MTALDGDPTDRDEPSNLSGQSDIREDAKQVGVVEQPLSAVTTSFSLRQDGLGRVDQTFDTLRVVIDISYINVETPNEEASVGFSLHNSGSTQMRLVGRLVVDCETDSEDRGYDIDWIGEPGKSKVAFIPCKRAVAGIVWGTVDVE